VTSSLGSVVKCENSLSLSLSLSRSRGVERASFDYRRNCKDSSEKKKIIILGEDEFDFIDYSQTHTE
jgi:hypothetical protein